MFNPVVFITDKIYDNSAAKLTSLHIPIYAQRIEA